MKEIIFIKVNHCSEKDKNEIFRIAKIFDISIIDYNYTSILLECTQTEDRNDALIKLLQEKFLNRIEITRGGVVATEAIGISNR